MTYSVQMAQLPEMTKLIQVIQLAEMTKLVLYSVTQKCSAGEIMNMIIMSPYTLVHN